jgi:sulfate permease, SulP family
LLTQLNKSFKGYSFKLFRMDVLSGLVVGIIALPLGMAFAIASGVKPEYGIYTTIIAGILISLFGGSKFQIGGPTGAFVPILFGIVSTFGYENLLIAGFLSGFILFLMGIFKVGSVIKFIPRPVTIGFTSGIAVLIFSGQIATFLGLQDIVRHEAFLSNMKELLINIGSFNIYSIVIAVICLIIILLTPKLFPKIPGPLIGLTISSIIANLVFSDKIDTVASVYGIIPNTIPAFQIPSITFAKLEDLLPAAFIIAMLGGIESLLSAVVADGMTGTKHNSNRELVGQGIANMITPFFGGIPATGAIARTATNIKNGATSPVSGIVHSAFVLLILLVLAPWASQIPLASLAPILMIVAWNMSERKEFIHVLKTKTSDSFVMFITFLLTVFFNLTTAIEIGLILAVFLFAKQMSSLMIINRVLPDPSDKSEKVLPEMVSEARDCPQVSIFTIEGSLFFGAAETFANTVLRTINLKPKVLILRLGKVIYMDITGENSLAHIVKEFKKHGGIVLISGICPQPKEVLIKTGLYEKIGPNHFFERTEEAINYATHRLNEIKCIGCKHLTFRECDKLSRPFKTSEVNNSLANIKHN